MVRRFKGQGIQRVRIEVPPCKYYFSMIPSKDIYNHSSPEYQEGHIDKLNEQNGFFTKLEESVLKEGIINPILIAIGWAPQAIMNRLPQEMQDNFENEFICYSKGGSRLMTAQKHNMDIPCIVSDFVGRFADQEELDEEGIAACFKSAKVKVLHGAKGIAIRDLPHIHLDGKTAPPVKRKLEGYIVKYSVISSRRIKNPIQPDEKRIEKLNEENGFFEKLEASMLKDGIRNPIVVNAYIENDEVIFENRYGGSRLMLAQKHNLDIPCIIADFDNIFPEAELLSDGNKIKAKFKDTPRKVLYKPHGINISGCLDYHLEDE